MITFSSAAPFIACFAILRRGNTVAFLLRSNTGWMDGKYGLPSGKVEWNEPYTLGTIREAKEEIGVIIQPKHLRHAITIHRHGPDFDWVDVYFEVDDWDGEPYNAEPNLHGELVWLDLDNLPDNIIPHVKFALEQVATGNTYAEDDWPNS